MDWTLVAVAIAFSGTYAFAGTRAARRGPAERRHRAQRTVWAGSVLVAVLIVGLALTPDDVARWIIVALTVAMVAWAVGLAIRKNLGAGFLIRSAVVVVALALWATSNFVSEHASEPLFFVGLAVLVIGSQIMRSRGRRSRRGDTTSHP